MLVKIEIVTSSIFFFLEMEAEDLSGRELTIDSIINKVRDFKNKFKNEDLTDELSLNKVSADTTGEFFLFECPLRKRNKMLTTVCSDNIILSVIDAHHLEYCTHTLYFNSFITTIFCFLKNGNLPFITVHLVVFLTLQLLSAVISTDACHQ